MNGLIALRRVMTLLCLLALVASSLGRVSFTWMCEGRVCSPDLSKCCCVSPDEIRDNECNGATEASPKGVCTGGCDCEAKPTVAKSASEARTATPQVVNAIELPEVPIMAPLWEAVQPFATLEAPQVRPNPPPCGCSDPFCCASALRAPPSLLA